jgi:O-succinylbenzoate synthase
MKIERITLYHIRMPLVSPFETSFGRETARDCILIEIAADGLTGFGECVADRDPGYSYETTGTSWHILGEFILPMMLPGLFQPLGFSGWLRPGARPLDG